MTVVLPNGGKRKELGHLLVQQGLLTEEQLAAALACQQQSGKALGQALVEMALVGRRRHHPCPRASGGCGLCRDE